MLFVDIYHIGLCYINVDNRYKDLSYMNVDINVNNCKLRRIFVLDRFLWTAQLNKDFLYRYTLHIYTLIS